MSADSYKGTSVTLCTDGMPSRLLTSKALDKDTWRKEKEAHRKRVLPWVESRTSRSMRADWHPVYDFLFEYYPFRPAHLQRWSPGVGILLIDAAPSNLDWADHFVFTTEGAYLSPTLFPQRRREFLKWATHYLEETSRRVPSFGCFGLHEWAMVYKTDVVRHEYVPLRLPQDAIQEVVERSELRCSHFDAYRFFTPAAVPRNRNILSRETTPLNDQRGCIHVTMDLYRFSHKIAPWVSSSLVADTFLLAADAREIDMRASPYDLSGYGFPPIKIEEKEGREEYVVLQRELSERAVPLRARLLDTYRGLVDSCSFESETLNA